MDTELLAHDRKPSEKIDSQVAIDPKRKELFDAIDRGFREYRELISRIRAVHGEKAQGSIKRYNSLRSKRVGHRVVFTADHYSPLAYGFNRRVENANAAPNCVDARKEGRSQYYPLPGEGAPRHTALARDRW